MKNLTQRTTLIMALASGFLLLPGCLSDNPGSSSLAFVDIEVGDAAAIRKETIRVFEDDNYQLVQEIGGEMTFEREPTQRDIVMYKRYQENITMRVIVAIEPRRRGGYLLRADAFVMRQDVQDAVLRIAKRPYQNMLNRIQASLVEENQNEVE